MGKDSNSSERISKTIIFFSFIILVFSNLLRKLFKSMLYKLYTFQTQIIYVTLITLSFNKGKILKSNISIISDTSHKYIVKTFFQIQVE